MLPRETFSDQVKKIRSYYQTICFMRQEMLSCLNDAPKAERWHELTSRIPGFFDDTLSEFMAGDHLNYVDLKNSIDYYASINALLSENDRNAFFEKIKHRAIFNIMRCVLNARQINETEREALTGMLCKFLKENMPADMLKNFCHLEAIDKKTFLDYAKHHCSQGVIEQIYELTNGKKLEKHRLSFKNLFHSENKKSHQEKMIPKILHENQVTTEERSAAIKKGKQILLPVFGLGFEEHSKDKRELNEYVINCLSTDAGLYAVGSGLLTFENARVFAKNRTLECFLEDPCLPFLRLYTPEQLASLKPYQIAYAKGDYAIFALEEKIITCEQLSRMCIDEHYAMHDIFTYYGIVALRDNLLSLDSALVRGRQSMSTLENLFTDEGVADLRKQKAKEIGHTH